MPVKVPSRVPGPPLANANRDSNTMARPPRLRPLRTRRNYGKPDASFGQPVAPNMLLQPPGSDFAKANPAPSPDGE